MCQGTMIRVNDRKASEALCPRILANAAVKDGEGLPVRLPAQHHFFTLSAMVFFFLDFLALSLHGSQTRPVLCTVVYSELKKT